MPNSITGLLEAALPKPAHIASSDGGAALALALHCLMVREGFNVVDETGRGKHSVYNPAGDWNGKYPDQWVFVYSKDGYAKRFVLHCSLQTATKRMFIHASEEGNPHNVCVLGLQLTNYVPDISRLKSNSWEGVLVNQVKLSELFKQHLAEPLKAQAEEVQLVPPHLLSPSQSADERAQRQGRRVSWPSGGDDGSLPPFGWSQHYTVLAITGALMALGSVVVWQAMRVRA